MFSLLIRVQEYLGYTARQTGNFGDLHEPKRSLTSISSDLSKEVVRLRSGRMISRKLKGRLSTLSQEERTFLVDCADVNGATPLTKACARGLSKVVKYLCRACSPDLTKRHQWTHPKGIYEKRMAPALWHAVVANQLDTVKVLLEVGADINAVSDTGSTPINSACFLGLEKMVAYLLKSGANINIPNIKGCTCLINSIKHENILAMLLKHGADIYARDSFNKTVLHYAIEVDCPAAVTRLLKKGSKPFRVYVKDHREFFISAVLESKRVSEILRPILLDASREILYDVEEIRGCINYFLRIPCFQIWIAVARSRHASDVVKRTNRPIAHFKYRRECVSEQELRGLKTEEHVMYQTLMIWLRVLGPTNKHRIIGLEVLFQNLISVDKLFATRIGFLLLEQRTEIHGLFDVGVAKTSYAVMKLCCELASTGRAIDFDISFESLKIIKEKVEVCKVGLDQLSESSQNFFDWALTFIVALLYVVKISLGDHKQKADFFQYVHNTLLANGREEAQLRTARTGYTLLHLAILRGNFFYSLGIRHLEVVEVLLFCGAPVNAVCSDGSSPLFVAAASENYIKEIVELLLRYGAHYDQVGPGGDTAMEVLRRCLDHSYGALQPPENLPTVRSLRCLSALALVKTGVDIQNDAIPQFLRRFLVLHIHGRVVL